MSLGSSTVEIPGNLSKGSFEDRMRAKAKLMAESVEVRSIDKGKETALLVSLAEETRGSSRA